MNGMKRVIQAGVAVACLVLMGCLSTTGKLDLTVRDSQGKILKQISIEQPKDVGIKELTFIDPTGGNLTVKGYSSNVNVQALQAQTELLGLTMHGVVNAAVETAVGAAKKAIK